MTEAFTESVAHGIFTVELILGIFLGVLFIAQYAFKPWWSNQGGRLIMGTISTICLMASGGFLFRLGWQEEALTLLIPTCGMVLLLLIWWNVSLWKAKHTTALGCALLISVTVKDLGYRLHSEGLHEEAKVVLTQAKILEDIAFKK